MDALIPLFFLDKAKTERKKSALEQIREAEQAQKVRLEEQRKRDLKRLGINPDPEPILPLKKTKKEPVKWIRTGFVNLLSFFIFSFRVHLLTTVRGPIK